jgi:PPM family protein phosphatase
MTLLRSGSASDTGLVRSVNQDLAVETSNLFAVADGMGGHAGGEVASRLAVDALTAAFGRQPTGFGLSEAVTEANGVVWRHSQDHPDLRGMGTTLTAAALVNEDGRDVLALVNVGDSRSYRFHDGELTQITTDHSLAEEMVRTGELTEAEAAVHPHRHILTRALGVATDVAVDLWRIQPVRGDRYLLCSDGLTNELSVEQIAQVLSSVSDPQKAADLLVQAARTHGGSDNITVVVVDVVVGETDDQSTPTVAVVNSDFTKPLPLPQEFGPGVAAAAPIADAKPAPGRRPAGHLSSRSPAPMPPAHHLPGPGLRDPAGGGVGRCPLRRALVRHQLVLRGREEQRTGHLPGTSGRLPLVPPGRSGAHRGHHRGRALPLPGVPPGGSGGVVSGQRSHLCLQSGR